MFGSLWICVFYFVFVWFALVVVFDSLLFVCFVSSVWFGFLCVCLFDVYVVYCVCDLLISLVCFAFVCLMLPLL